MPPEPDAHAVLARAAYQKILDGEDAVTVCLWVAAEAVKQERQRQAARAGWQDETTPTCDLWARTGGPVPTRPVRPSARPTAPPPAACPDIGPEMARAEYERTAPKPRTPAGVYRGTANLDPAPTGRTEKRFPSPVPPPPAGRKPR